MAIGRRRSDTCTGTVRCGSCPRFARSAERLAAAPGGGYQAACTVTGHAQDTDRRGRSRSLTGPSALGWRGSPAARERTATADAHIPAPAHDSCAFLRPRRTPPQRSIVAATSSRFAKHVQENHSRRFACHRLRSTRPPSCCLPLAMCHPASGKSCRSVDARITGGVVGLSVRKRGYADDSGRARVRAMPLWCDRCGDVAVGCAVRSRAAGRNQQP